MKHLTFITTMAGHAWGGSEELWVKLADDALSQGHTVRCSIFNWGKLPTKIEVLKSKGVKLHKRHRFIYPQLHKKVWGKFIEKTIAKREMHKALNGSDKAIISMGGFVDLEVNAFRKPLLETNVPFSLIVHVNPDDYYLNNSKIEEIVSVCKKAEKVYFVSNRLWEIAIRQTGYSFPNGEIIVNPVNMDEIGVLPWFSTETVQMAIVGRLDAKVKGHAILLQVLSDKKWKNRSWHLNVYGVGEDLQYFQHLANSFEIQDRVTFHGFTNDIRNDIWAKNHILVMPSYYEGMPISLVEAMLSGRTAVATDVGGNAEIIEDGVTGFISYGVNRGAFDKALETAWQQRDEWKEMGGKAFESANRLFENQDKINKNIY